MLALKKWLPPFKVTEKGKPYNVGSLAGGLYPHGGRWLIPPEKRETFYRLYAAAVQDTSNYL